jgi:hypothetical protein
MQLEVLDTSGAEQFTSLHEVYIKVSQRQRFSSGANADLRNSQDVGSYSSLGMA